MTAYDQDNVFARILRGELPCARIYETDDVLGFMDVMPQSEGHCLVIPKVPSRNILDAGDETLRILLPEAARLARAAVAALKADGVTIMQFNEAPAGQTVFHLHVHVIPRYEGRALAPHAGGMAEPELLAAQAERIRAALALA